MAPRYLRPALGSRQAGPARSLTSAAAVHQAQTRNSSAATSSIFQRLRYQTSAEAQLEATIAAVAGGPQRNQIFLTMINKAAAEHHLPWFIKSLRAMQAGPAYSPIALTLFSYQNPTRNT